MRQEISSLRQQKPRYGFDWRTLNGTSGRTVALAFSVGMFLFTALCCYLANAGPGGNMPDVHLIVFAWPGIPFVVMLHLIKIVKKGS